MKDLLSVLEPLADLLAEKVAQRLAKPAADDYVDARGSGLGVRTFRLAAKAGELPVYRVGKRWVAKRSDVQAYVERQRVTFGERAEEKEPDALERAIAAGRLRVVGRRV